MSGRIPPLYALRAFEVAARSSSFTLAAEELSLTQGAISRHIKNLEAIFGCHLFERKGPKISLTEQGKVLARELSEGFRIIENACYLFKDSRTGVRLKAPTSLTARWLLDSLRNYKKTYPDEDVQLNSVWMDVDVVDFYSEPFDCAILLDNGHFSDNITSIKLLDEWLIPICSPNVINEINSLCDVEEVFLNSTIIHPSPDRRDWKRWLARLNLPRMIEAKGGLVFDTLDQGVLAAMQGHGISIGDLSMVAAEVQSGVLELPFKKAVHTGDSYYLVWPKGSPKEPYIRKLGDFLKTNAPDIDIPSVSFLRKKT
ncbi:LysR substrate-binding domain-containing protein [Halomonas sp. WWR20]